MKTTTRTQYTARRSMLGLSIVELMVAMTLGLLILAGLASIFASSSAARSEMERSSRQIENGRFAMELLTEDLRLAGFYGELNVSVPLPAALPDPCSVDPADWHNAIPLAIQAFDNGANLSSTCISIIGNRRLGTDVLIVRFANTCEAGVGGCEGVLGNKPYLQVSKCAKPNNAPENLQRFPPAGPSHMPGYLLGLSGATNFTLSRVDCANRAGIRRYHVRIYFVSNDNGKGQNIPTLKRLELDGMQWVEAPLVEGIEELNLEYGIDWKPLPPLAPDGAPDSYTADPSNWTGAGCPVAPTNLCTAMANWGNVTTVRINLLARNLEESPGYTDTKKYLLGFDAGGMPQEASPGGSYKRHAYSSVVRLINVAQRRERPA